MMAALAESKTIRGEKYMSSERTKRWNDMPICASPSKLNAKYTFFFFLFDRPRCTLKKINFKKTWKPKYSASRSVLPQDTYQEEFTRCCNRTKEVEMEVETTYNISDNLTQCMIILVEICAEVTATISDCHAFYGFRKFHRVMLPFLEYSKSSSDTKCF